MGSGAFGDRCYSLPQVTSKLAANDGHWPGVADFTESSLPAAIAADPYSCFTLPEGDPCFAWYQGSEGKGDVTCTVYDDSVTAQTIATSKASAASRMRSPASGSCERCIFVDLSEVGHAWQKVGNSFGSRCYNAAEARASIEGNGGHWPGVVDFRVTDLPPTMRANENVCFSIPEGFPCFAAPVAGSHTGVACN